MEGSLWHPSSGTFNLRSLMQPSSSCFPLDEIAFNRDDPSYSCELKAFCCCVGGLCCSELFLFLSQLWKITARSERVSGGVLMGCFFGNGWELGHIARDSFSFAIASSIDFKAAFTWQSSVRNSVLESWSVTTASSSRNWIALRYRPAITLELGASGISSMQLYDALYPWAISILSKEMASDFTLL